MSFGIITDADRITAEIRAVRDREPDLAAIIDTDVLPAAYSLQASIRRLVELTDDLSFETSHRKPLGRNRGPGRA